MEAELLGPPEDLKGKDILEIGAGAAQRSRRPAAQGARPVALDLSHRQLQHALRIGGGVPLVEADAGALPFARYASILACSAYGALPFVADPVRVLKEVHRVLRPGGRFVFSVTHPIRWAFPDEPGPEGLSVSSSYFDRTPYVEQEMRRATRCTSSTTGRSATGYGTWWPGFRLLDLVEPQWPAWNTQEWAACSPLRGNPIPGTAIFGARGDERVIRYDALDALPRARRPARPGRSPGGRRQRRARGAAGLPRRPSCCLALSAGLLGGPGDGRPGRRVVVAEPRRIAARAAARRMAWLLGEKVGESVGFTVRGERVVGPRARVEVVTTGVLLLNGSSGTRSSRASTRWCSTSATNVIWTPTRSPRSSWTYGPRSAPSCGSWRRRRPRTRRGGGAAARRRARRRGAGRLVSGGGGVGRLRYVRDGRRTACVSTRRC